MKYSILIVMFLGIVGCTNPSGSSWAVADLNKYDKNYLPFPTKQLIIGSTKKYIILLLGENYELVEAGSEYEIYAYQQWVSVTGPDYVKKTLYLKFINNQLKYWKVTNDTISIVPRNW